jgi:hypothetical protein
MGDPSPHEVRLNLPGASAPVKLPGGGSLGSEPWSFWKRGTSSSVHRTVGETLKDGQQDGY